jgi:predicted dehydrogenase
MQSPVKIGVIGAGGNTRHKHLPGFQAIEGVSVEVVCNRSAESSQGVADAFGIPRIAHEWQEVVQDPDIDAVMIGTWPYLHAPISIAALNAGKHVLCEARMAMNQPEAEAMVAAAASAPHLVSQVVPSPFTLRWDRFIKRQLDDGRIGELLAVDVFASGGGFVNDSREMSWRDDITLSGLNTMAMGIYYEALARWVGHAATVNANGRVHVKFLKDHAGVAHPKHIPDHVDVFGNLESGASYHIRCSQLTGACPTPNDFILYGSTGTLRLNLKTKELILDQPEADTQVLEVPADEQDQWRVEAEFIGAIRGEEAVRLTTFDEGLRYMTFTQKVADALGIAPSEFRNP